MIKGASQNRANQFLWWMPTFVTLLCMGISILTVFNIHKATALSMLKDSGLVQILTALALIAGCILCLQRAFRKISPAFKWLQLSYLLLIYAMREMDFHRLFTEAHVSKWKFYIGPFPLHEKIIGGGVVLLTIVVMIHFIRINFRHFWKSLKAMQSWAVHVIIWAVLLFSSQMLDKSRWHGNFYEIVVEENMEFGAAIMIFMVLLKYPLPPQKSR